MPALTVRAVLSDAWDVYRLLFQRSIPIAALVYALINAVDIATQTIENRGARIGLDILGFVLLLAGPILVQGALVKIVRSVHEGTRPESAGSLLRDAGERLGSLVGASIIYSLGVVVGLLLLVVPGLLAAARWALMAPSIMLEGKWAFPAQERSRQIVRGEIPNGLGDRTRLSLGVVVIGFLLTAGVPDAIGFFAGARIWDYGTWPSWLFAFATGVLTAPYQAHLLSVLYYRLVEPHRAAIDPQVRTWPSVWHGPPETV